MLSGQSILPLLRRCLPVTSVLQQRSALISTIESKASSSENVTKQEFLQCLVRFWFFDFFDFEKKKNNSTRINFCFLIFLKQKTLQLKLGCPTWRCSTTWCVHLARISIVERKRNNRLWSSKLFVDVFFLFTKVSTRNSKLSSIEIYHSSLLCSTLSRSTTTVEHNKHRQVRPTKHSLWPRNAKPTIFEEYKAKKINNTNSF